MGFKKITEQSSLYQDIEKMTTAEVLASINQEDAKVADAIKQILPDIQAFVDAAAIRLLNGGRLFYIGAGTSGRLGVVDASECPPTFGVSHDLVVGIISGGDGAIRQAVEFAEDSKHQGWEDLKAEAISKEDVVIGIAASGTTPYVIGAIEKSNEHNILTASITCNPNSPIDLLVDYSMSCAVGPEFITGSTRMKSGTAQKMILNMVSTTLMIKMGRVKGNRMVDMQLSNNKLVDRGTKMVMEALNISYEDANALLIKHGSVRKAVIAKS